MPMDKQANPKNSGLSWGPRSRLDETGPQVFGSTYVERTLGIVMRIQQQQNIANTFHPCHHQQQRGTARREAGKLPDLPVAKSPTLESCTPAAHRNNEPPATEREPIRFRRPLPCVTPPTDQLTVTLLSLEVRVPVEGVGLRSRGGNVISEERHQVPSRRRAEPYRVRHALLDRANSKKRAQGKRRSESPVGAF